MSRLVFSDDDIDVVNFCRLYILYIFACILFCQINYTSLPSLTKYDWVIIVHFYIVVKILTISTRIKILNLKVSNINGKLNLLFYIYIKSIIHINFDY